MMLLSALIKHSRKEKIDTDTLILKLTETIPVLQKMMILSKLIRMQMEIIIIIKAQNKQHQI